MVDRPIKLSLVSILVPVFNGERYLRESLDSILAQAYPNTEVLVMDNASTDSTPGIIASYGDRIRCYRHKTNLGIYGNVNSGIAVARGDYIAVYHADDIYHPHIVQRQVNYLEDHTDVGAVFCQDIFIDPQGREFGRLELPAELRGGKPLEFPVILNSLLKYKNAFLRCPSSMVRACVYQTLGHYRDQEFGVSADLEMWLRIAKKYPISILEEYLFWYRYGHNNSSLQHRHLRMEPEGYFRIMDVYLEDGGRAVATADALAAYEAHRAEDRLMVAVNNYILGRSKEAKKILNLVRLSQILGSPQVQKIRLLLLLLIMRVLVRVPRIQVLAALFYRRWHARTAPALRVS